MIFILGGDIKKDDTNLPGSFDIIEVHKIPNYVDIDWQTFKQPHRFPMLSYM